MRFGTEGLLLTATLGFTATASWARRRLVFLWSKRFFDETNILITLHPFLQRSHDYDELGISFFRHTPCS